VSRRHWLLAASLAGSLWLALSEPRTAVNDAGRMGGRTPDAPLPLPKPADITRFPKASVDVLELHARETLTAGTSANSTGHKLFDSHTWALPPVEPANPAPPSAPPLPYAYLGKKFDGRQWEVYLARGDEPLVVREQSTLDGTYRVDAIKPPSLSLVFLPLNQRHTMNIGDAD
jgi:hypothetical protein